MRENKRNRSVKGSSSNTYPLFVGNDVIYRFAEGDVPLLDCLQGIDVILANEGSKNTNSFNGAVALNLDKYERLSSQGQMDRTVDMVVGCENNMLLMVEAKLRVYSTDNLIGDSIRRKVRHSRDILNRKDNYSVFPNAIILLNNKFFERNKHKLLRLLSNSLSIVHPLKVEDFRREVFGVSR